MEAGARRVPVTVIVPDEAEGTFVESNGEGNHGRGKVQNQKSKWRARRGR